LLVNKKYINIGHILSGIIFSGIYLSALMNTTDTLKFGDYLRSLRKQKSLPLRKIAAELDIDPSTLGKMEKNTRSPSFIQLNRLAEIFNVPLSELHSRHLSDRYAQELRNLNYRSEVLMLTTMKLKQSNTFKP
jgi:HTH-type transcriptional regulator, competence development regulator